MSDRFDDIDDDSAIAQIAAGFLAGSLPKAEWTHAAHFAVALWLLRHRPALADPAAMRGLIRAYNDATGTANTPSGGYHETITIASMRAAQAYMDRYPPDAPLCRILAGLMAGAPGRSDWLLAFWHRGTLFGAEARDHWVAPDRAPLVV